ncbi:hypothetical protein Tco_0415373 [Tanacetum coccineum]
MPYSIFTNLGLDFIVLDMLEDIKVSMILGRSFLSTAHAKLDLEARLMGQALILNKSLDPKYEDYIELNDLNEPWELRRNQEVNDLGPTIEEGVIIVILSGVNGL